MKVLVLTSTYPRFTGDPTAPFLEPLVRHVAALGHEVHVVVPEHRDWSRPDTEHGIRYHRFRYSPRRSWTPWGFAQSLEGGVRVRRSLVALAPVVFASAARACRELVKREGIDLVHAHWVVPNGPIAAFALRGLPVPLIVTVHGSDVTLASRSHVMGAAARWSLARSTRVTAVSRYMLEQVAQLGVAPGKLELIPLGMGLSTFHPDPPAAQRVRDQLGIEGDETMVLGIGRLIEWKGFDYLIDAMRVVRERGGTVRLVIAGDGDLRSDLMQQTQRLGLDRSVTFVGAVARADVPAYYAAADVVAIPSIRHDAGFVEGLGYVALEALASGTPIVASDVGGLGETVRDGEVGILVHEREPEELAAAILHLAGDPTLRERLGANARARALAAPSWDDVAARWVETYQEVAARPAPSGSKLRASSERFDATRHETTEDVVMGLYHRYSYELAAQSLDSTSSVLDVGFGEGYGSTILPGDYLGVELDPALVAYARSRYTARFETYDGRRLPDGPFDLVVSFHVIEHVHDLDPWLAEIARVGRRAMFATPNRIHRIGHGERPWNRYHVREFSGEELRSVLLRHFAAVTVYGVCAPREVEAVELARYARARTIARLDPLGVRYRLPTRVDGWLRHKLRKPAPLAETRVSLADFSHSEADVERGLMLLAEAR
jgi:glycosyltransferase involved in cell wall biosynthesis/SAM-dependent methyltransferase